MNNDFSSIDKLVEFGLGLAVAQQMVATMNHVISNSCVAGADRPLQDTAKQYYVVLDGAQAGPLSECELARLVVDNRITDQTLVWRSGMGAWKPAAEVPEIGKLRIENTMK